MIPVFGPDPAFAAAPSSPSAGSGPSGLQSGVGRATPDLFATSSAVISPCGRYRYRLERDGPGEGRTVVLMVNPSTADAEQDDATIRKLRGFGARNHWGRIIVGNLFAYRATDVRELAGVVDPIGSANDTYLQSMVNEADRVIVAWGPVSKVPARLRNRWLDVWGEMPMTKPVLSIGASAKCGHPKHPLMLAYSSPIMRWYPSVGMVPRDSDGTATAAANGDLPVLKDCQARAESIARKDQPHD